MDIKLFEEKKIRTYFDAIKEKWFFSIVHRNVLEKNKLHELLFL